MFSSGCYVVILPEESFVAGFFGIVSTTIFHKLSIVVRTQSSFVIKLANLCLFWLFGSYSVWLSLPRWEVLLLLEIKIMICDPWTARNVVLMEANCICIECIEDVVNNAALFFLLFFFAVLNTFRKATA